MHDTKISSRQKQILTILQHNQKGLLRIELENLLLEKDVEEFDVKLTEKRLH